MGLFDTLFKNKQEEEKISYYTENEIEIIEDYITENFGEIETVFHEIVSPDIHLDIYVIPPTEDNNYYKLITVGMGAYKMTVPKLYKKYDFARAELIAYLPPDWDIKSEDEKYYWPVRMMKTVAGLPICDDTWIGFGHTFSKDDENSPFAENTGFCSMMLLTPLNKDYQRVDFALKGKGRINFYQLFPLYEEELDVKMSKGLNELFARFSDEDLVPVINIERQNYGLEPIEGEA